MRKRRNLRFPSERNLLAEVRPAGAPPQDVLVGLVRDESHTGCCLVLVAETPPGAGAEVSVKVGRLPETAGCVRWVRTLDRNIVLVGIGYAPLNP